MCPYTNRPLKAEERKFNNAMSSMRTTVENAFGLIQCNWSLNALKHGLKSRLRPVAACFEVSVLLTNCLTCTRQNTSVNSRFGLDPLSLDEYLDVEVDDL